MSGIKDRIKAARDLTPKPYDVPEWPDTAGELFLRKLSPRQQLECQKRFGPREDGQPHDTLTFFPLALAFFLCDADGKLLFTDEEACEVLVDKNATILQRILQDAMVYNGMAVEAQEELAKN